MRKFLVLIFSMPLLASLFGLFICFAPGSLAKKLHRGVDTHLRSLENKNISRLGKAQLATLYTSMILIGRVPFPESADNLFFLFFVIFQNPLDFKNKSFYYDFQILKKLLKKNKKLLKVKFIN